MSKAVALKRSWFSIKKEASNKIQTSHSLPDNANPFQCSPATDCYSTSGGVSRLQYQQCAERERMREHTKATKQNDSAWTQSLSLFIHQIPPSFSGKDPRDKHKQCRHETNRNGDGTIRLQRSNRSL